MADKRKVKLRQLDKKMKDLQGKYPTIDLSDSHLLNDMKKHSELRYEHFHLKFDIEHCPTCSQLLKEYQ